MKTTQVQNGLATAAPVILLVEDESQVRLVAAEVLSHAGYNVIASSGPRDALDIARQGRRRVDMLLTDLVMPGMNGAELARQLLSSQPDLVTVFMSGYAEHQVRKTMPNHDDSSTPIHLQKPFSIGTLLACVANALNGGAGRK